MVVFCRCDVTHKYVLLCWKFGGGGGGGAVVVVVVVVVGEPEFFYEDNDIFIPS